MEIFKVTPRSGTVTTTPAVSPPSSEIQDPAGGEPAASNEPAASQPVTNQQKAAGEEPVTNQAGLRERFFTGMGKAMEDPKQMSKTIVGAIPKAMFLMLPLFALLLRLCYLKSLLNYPQWFIFALHIHTVVFLLMGPVALLRTFPFGPTLEFLFFLYALAYLFLSLRRLTNQSRTITVIKIIASGFLYLLALSATLIGLSLYFILKLGAAT